MGKTILHTPEKGEITIKEVILDFRRWIKFLWSKKWTILVAGILGGLLGLCYAFVKVPLYTASTTFVVESSDSKGGLGRLAGMAAVAGIDLGGDAGGLFQGDNIMELYKSRRMLVQALLSKIHPDSNELLIDRYLLYSGIKENWEERPDLLKLNFGQDPTTLSPLENRLRDSVLTSLSNDIRKNALVIDRLDKKLSVLKVDITSPDEMFSKVFNESLVKQVNDFYIKTKTKKFTDNIRILQQKVDSVRAVMKGSIYSAAMVSDATPNLNPTRQVQRIAPTQEAQFSAEANKAVLSQLLQNLELTKMTLLQEQPLIQLVDRPVYPLKVSRLGKIKGFIIGGLIFGFLAVGTLVISKWYRNMMAEDGI